jgi:hypothetical protein
MICHHGFDSPDRCFQCPKEPQQTRKRLDTLIRSLKSADMRREFEIALAQHDRAFQDSYIAQLEVKRAEIKRLNDVLDVRGNFDSAVIANKLEEIGAMLRKRVAR